MIWGNQWSRKYILCVYPKYRMLVQFGFHEYISHRNHTMEADKKQQFRCNLKKKKNERSVCSLTMFYTKKELKCNTQTHKLGWMDRVSSSGQKSHLTSWACAPLINHVNAWTRDCNSLDLMYEMPPKIKETLNDKWVWELQERLENPHSFVKQRIRISQWSDRNISMTERWSGRNLNLRSVFMFTSPKKVGKSS